MSADDCDHVLEGLASFDAGGRDALDGLIDPSYFVHVPGPDEPTADTVFAGFLAEFVAAAPDLRIEIPDLARQPDGDLHGTAVVSGTMIGRLWGVEPTGRTHRFEFPVRLRPRGGRFAVQVDLATPDAIGVLRDLEVVNPADQMHLPPRHPVVMPDFLIKTLFDGQVAEKPCPHLDEVRVTWRDDVSRCDDCGPDDVWPTVRLCLTCGHLGCCDTSTNKHARAHFESTGHPMMRSVRPGERWLWCYADAAAFRSFVLDRIAARLAGAS